MRKKMIYVLLMVLLILTAIALAFKKVFERLDEKVESTDTNTAPAQASILYVPTSSNDSSLQAKISELENLTEIALMAGENIGFGKVVAIQNGTVYLFDPTDEDMYNLAIGIAKTSAVSGNLIRVALAGKISGFTGLTANKMYFATLNGEITPVQPEKGMIRSVGFSVSTTELITDFSQKYLYDSI
ncbi:hypothetical protein [Flectobacillus sp. BAB-3569]|uniref:hypothetical protein n=1 Tax=Flectobacillus sp. BAB-3569 TaxID=1509483 RepID=UPI000BA328B5|nr:hypothetical protein [Flectobacillus sp. BAB-3569]PAC29238.1 hypothetical protein BWI92_16550 [Flectobacillus sp. BAB-3569]